MPQSEMFGPFELLELLHQTLLSQVYKARREGQGGLVALKRLHREHWSNAHYLRRLGREGRALTSVEHPNLVRILETDEREGRYLAMEFLEGQDLRSLLHSLLREQGRLPIHLACEYARQAAQGLAHIHSKGWVHRDVKPANLFVVSGRPPLLKVLDFGLVRFDLDAEDGQSRDNSTLTHEGDYLGTDDYIAPEQIRKPHKVKFHADIYSLGCTLYHLLSGKPPFPDCTHYDKLERHQTQEPEPVERLRPDVPHALAETVRRMMRKEPGDRHRTSELVVADLARFVPTEPVVLPSTILETPRHPAQDLFTNTRGMEFALVPKGTLWMGGGGGTPGTRQVPIADDFYLGIYPVTQGQWEALMGNNPSWFSRQGQCRDKVDNISDTDLQQFPVEHVSWEDVQTFIAKLNDKDQSSGWLYRLPREVEWEYACRGGPISKEASAYHFYLDQPRNSLTSTDANFDGNYPDGDADKGPYLERTTKVGSYNKPNRLGLHDMHGNVWEWCEDVYREGAGHRVVRGGSWAFVARYCRSANRNALEPSDRNAVLGFRLAAVPPSR